MDTNRRSDPESRLLLCFFKSVDHGDFGIEFEEITIIKFKKRIRELSRGPVPIGEKGLYWGTSRLECFLSKTDSAYPGDVDFVLLDRNRDVSGIIEFKKHTKSEPISEQKLGNYYPSPDGRKYDRLAILRDYFDVSIPLLCLYYPTRTSFSEGRLELLAGTNGDLKTSAASNFKLDAAARNDRFLLKKIEKAIEYHYKSQQ